MAISSVERHLKDTLRVDDEEGPEGGGDGGGVNGENSGV